MTHLKCWTFYAPQRTPPRAASSQSCIWNRPLSIVSHPACYCSAVVVVQTSLLRMAKRTSRDYEATLEQQLKQFKPVRGKELSSWTCSVAIVCPSLQQQHTLAKAGRAFAQKALRQSCPHQPSNQPPLRTVLVPFECCLNMFDTAAAVPCSRTPYAASVNPFPMMMDAARHTQAQLATKQDAAAAPAPGHNSSTVPVMQAAMPCTLCSHCG